MAEHDALGHGIWQRGGVDVEVLPDPLDRRAPAVPPDGPADEAKTPRRRWWRWGFTAFGALLLVTLLWLIFTAPLSRALEPLHDPAMLLMSQEGRPIARRGAIKDEPVEAAKLDPLTPAAFIAIEDRRFRSHWGIDARAIVRAMPAHYDDVLVDIRARDARDSGRDAAPLKQAEDADLLDTSEMEIEEAIAAAIKLVEARLAQR